MRTAVIVLVACSTLFGTGTTRADLFEPFSTSNLNPFVQIYGPPTTSTGQITESGQLDWRLTTEIANNFTTSTAGAEAIAIDGETWRSALSVSYGLNDRWEVGLSLPYLRHDGGSLDNFIENWHKVFGLPNGGRRQTDTNQLVYAWNEGSVPLADFRRTESGIGDMRLHLGYRLKTIDDRQWTLRAGVKLPTGDVDKLTGSDSTDLFTSLHVSQADLFGRPTLAFHGSVGFLWLGSGELADHRLEDWVTYGSVALAWQPWSRVSLKTQLDFNSAFYNSKLKEVGDFSVQLVVGGAIRLTDRLVLDIGVIEDVVTDTSPDVALHFSLRSRF